MDERTEQMEMTGFPLAGTYVSVAAIGAGVLQVLRRDWEGSRIEIERLVGGGDSVVAVD